MSFVFRRAALMAALSFMISTAEAGTTMQTALHNSTQAKAMTPEQAEVWRVVEEWNSAFTANDPDRYFAFIDEEITVLTPSSPYRVEGRADDRAEFEFGLKKGYSRVGYFEEIAPIVRVFNDTAIVTYFNRGHYGPEEGGQMVYLKETDVLHRENGSWRIVHIHVSK